MVLMGADLVLTGETRTVFQRATARKDILQQHSSHPSQPTTISTWCPLVVHPLGSTVLPFSRSDGAYRSLGERFCASVLLGLASEHVACCRGFLLVFPLCYGPEFLGPEWVEGLRGAVDATFQLLFTTGTFEEGRLPVTDERLYVGRERSLGPRRKRLWTTSDVYPGTSGRSFTIRSVRSARQVWQWVFAVRRSCANFD